MTEKALKNKLQRPVQAAWRAYQRRTTRCAVFEDPGMRATYKQYVTAVLAHVAALVACDRWDDVSQWLQTDEEAELTYVDLGVRDVPPTGTRTDISDVCSLFKSTEGKG